MSIKHEEEFEDHMMTSSQLLETQQAMDAMLQEAMMMRTDLNSLMQDSRITIENIMSHQSLNTGQKADNRAQINQQMQSIQVN